jgi:L-malate glycosyltransferase
MPKILHLFSTFEAGGPQVRVCRMIAHWGAAVTHEIAAHDGRYGARALLGEEAPVSINQAFPFSSRLQIGKALRASDADLICTYNWGAMDVVFANRLIGQRPLVHHDEGFGADEALRTNPKRNLYRRLAYGGAFRIVCVSQPLMDIARRNWRQPLRKLVYMPNGIDVDAFARQPEAGAIPGLVRLPGEIVIGTVARLSEVKNLPLLVEAVARVRMQMPVKLVIVGEGPEKEKIRAAARSGGIDESLIMPGFLPEPQHYIGLFDIFALSSDSEQFPISLAEAMAAGLPCVTTDVGDCRTMLEPGEHKVIVPRGDATALAEALTLVARDEPFRQQLGIANRMRARAHYGWPVMMQRYAGLYSDVSGVRFPA